MIEEGAQIEISTRNYLAFTDAFVLKFELMRELFCREREERAAAASAQHEENKAVIDTFSAGADGFCLKDCDDLVLISAIKDVFYGKTYLDPRIGVRLADFLSDSPNRHYLKDLYITSLDLEFLRSLPRPNDDARLKTILQKIAKIQL